MRTPGRYACTLRGTRTTTSSALLQSPAFAFAPTVRGYPSLGIDFPRFHLEHRAFTQNAAGASDGAERPTPCSSVGPQCSSNSHSTQRRLSTPVQWPLVQDESKKQEAPTRARPRRGEGSPCPRRGEEPVISSSAVGPDWCWCVGAGGERGKMGARRGCWIRTEEAV